MRGKLRGNPAFVVILTEAVADEGSIHINKNRMLSLQEIQKKIIAFRDARDWKQFHTPKDLATGLILEAGEVAEHFLWKDEAEIAEYLKTHKEEIGDEMGDVLNYLLIMANDFGIDLLDATDKKIDKNARKYPVEKSKGKHTKYTEL